MLLPYADQLANLVVRLWDEHGREAESFPAVAEKALNELPPDTNLQMMEIVDWVLQTNEFPQQLDLAENFGQPPVTLFNNGDFNIDVYFWLENDTSVHQHAFSGAFTVMAGTSVNCVYEFEPQHVFDDRLTTGTLVFKKAEILRTGDCRRILSGSRDIHSVYHVDYPSISVIIRAPDLSSLPQLSYIPPCLAYADDPELDTPLELRRRQVLRMLRRIDHPDYVDRLTKTLVSAGPSELLAVMLENRDYFIGRRDELRSLLLTLKKTHGELIDRIIDAFKTLAKKTQIKELRSLIRDPDVRFFLALLQSLEHREPILKMTTQRYPDCDPVEQILDWTKDLSAIVQADALGVGISETGMTILRTALEGSAEDLAGQSLQPMHSATAVATRNEAAQLQKHSLFRPLFY